MKRDFKIKTKLAFFVSVILSLTVLVCMVIADRISFDLLRNQKLESVRQEADNKSHLIYEHLTAEKEDVLLLSQFSQLEQMVLLKTQIHLDSAQVLQDTYEEIRQELGDVFLKIAKQKQNYLNIRYIDENGDEIVQVRKRDESIVIIPKTRLQYKGEKDYFKETAKLTKGKIYVSPLNLNKEFGQIEEPFLPVIRFGTPVFDTKGQRRGVIIINIRVAEVLEQLYQNHTEGNLYLIDNDGYFLLHHERSKEWGRDLAHKTRIQYDYPEDIARHIISPVPYQTEYKGKILISMPVFVSDNRNYFLKVVREYPKSLFFQKLKHQSLLFAILGTIVVSIAVFLSIYLVQSYINQLVQIRNDIKDVIAGKNPKAVTVRGNDEIDQIHRNTNLLTQSLYKMTEFAQAVGQGNFQVSEDFGTDVSLGKTLVEMRNDLQQAENERKINNWLTEGQNNFGNILRSSADIEELSNQVLSELIKHLHLNQGSFFILNENTKQMELMAAYAWERKKYLHKSIEKGEGLIGEVWQESRPVYLEEIPQNYIRITSGLGDANPDSLLVVPVKNSEQTIGIIELASFQKLKEHEIEFVYRICDITGATFASILNSFKTTKLLEETQKYAERLQMQEEEMRQNAEELSSTQEEMKRQIRDYERQVDHLQTELNKLNKS